jgi:hypothetical protein
MRGVRFPFASRLDALQWARALTWGTKGRNRQSCSDYPIVGAGEEKSCRGGLRMQTHGRGRHLFLQQSLFGSLSSERS